MTTTHHTCAKCLTDYEDNEWEPTWSCARCDKELCPTCAAKLDHAGWMSKSMLEVLAERDHKPKHFCCVGCAEAYAFKAMDQAIMASICAREDAVPGCYLRLLAEFHAHQIKDLP